MYLVTQGVKGGRLYEGEGRKLKRTLSHYCACTKLRFSDRMLRIQKIHIVLYNLPKYLHHARLSYTTKPSQNYKITDQCFHYRGWKVNNE